MWIFSRRLRRLRRGMQQAALFRRERQVVVSVVIVVIVVIVALGFGVCLRKSAGSARDIGGSFVDWWSTLAYLFSRRWRWSRRGIQQAVLFRRERQVDVCIVLELVSFWVLLFWVLSASSARSAGDILWFHLCNTDWVRLCVCLPQITRITQRRNAAKLYYFAEKDRLMFVLFGGCLGVVCVICEISGRLIRVSSVQYWLSTLNVFILFADNSDSAEECSLLHYLAEKDS